MSAILRVFGQQLWNLVVLLIWTRFFSRWGSFLWLMLISLHEVRRYNKKQRLAEITKRTDLWDISVFLQAWQKFLTSLYLYGGDELHELHEDPNAQSSSMQKKNESMGSCELTRKRLDRRQLKKHNETPYPQDAWYLFSGGVDHIRG